MPTTMVSPISILLVDDRKENLVALRAMLGSPDYRLMEATSGEEALELAHREDFGLILLDVMMPGMDGFGVASRLKQIDRARRVPIIFLTALAADIHQLSTAYEVGAVDYLIKPLDPDVVRRKVAVFADLHRQRLEIERQAALLRESERREQAYLEAQRTALAREEVLRIVSHELKNPLNVISTSGHHLASTTLREKNPARTQRTVEMIQRAAARMNRLLEDLQDAASLESGSLSLEKGVNRAASLVADCIEAFEPLAAEKTIAIRSDVERIGSVDVLCDRDRIFQVFSNVVGNALKFSLPGEAITIRASREDDDVVFAIADNGPGIAPEQLPRVFDRYWQARETARQGVGLGLAIAKGIIETHGGRMWVESVLGKGSTFYFSLPVSTTEQPSVARTYEPIR